MVTLDRRGFLALAGSGLVGLVGTAHASDAEELRYLAAELARGASTVAFDLPGRSYLAAFTKASEIGLYVGEELLHRITTQGAVPAQGSLLSIYRLKNGTLEEAASATVPQALFGTDRAVLAPDGTPCKAKIGSQYGLVLANHAPNAVMQILTAAPGPFSIVLSGTK